jgi:hypothetical protein
MKINKKRAVPRSHPAGYIASFSNKIDVKTHIHIHMIRLMLNFARSAEPDRSRIHIFGFTENFPHGCVSHPYISPVFKRCNACRYPTYRRTPSQ